MLRFGDVSIRRRSPLRDRPTAPGRTTRLFSTPRLCRAGAGTVQQKRERERRALPTSSSPSGTLRPVVDFLPELTLEVKGLRSGLVAVTSVSRATEGTEVRAERWCTSPPEFRGKTSPG